MTRRILRRLRDAIVMPDPNPQYGALDKRDGLPRAQVVEVEAVEERDQDVA